MVSVHVHLSCSRGSGNPINKLCQLRIVSQWAHSFSTQLEMHVCSGKFGVKITPVVQIGLIVQFLPVFLKVVVMKPVKYFNGFNSNSSDLPILLSVSDDISIRSRQHKSRRFYFEFRVAKLVIRTVFWIPHLLNVAATNITLDFLCGFYKRSVAFQ